MKIRYSIIGIALLLTFLGAPTAKAQDGLGGVLSRSAHAILGRSPQLAAADFDNDQKPDGVVLIEDGFLNGKRSFRIEFHVTAGRNNAITFSSTEAGLELSALDVNRDGAPDIVIEKPFTHERLQVYLNDGHGSFHTARTGDYPAENPSTPTWRADLAQGPPALCLPVTRSWEIGALRKISTIHPDLPGTPRLRKEDLLAQSSPRAPSSSRAPPSLLSL